MSVGVLVLVLVIVGIVVAVRRPGFVGSRVALVYAVGVALSLGGCVGALAWLGAETSGNRNLLHAVNPCVWSGLFVAGVLILVVNSVRTLWLRSRE